MHLEKPRGHMSGKLQKLPVILGDKAGKEQLSGHLINLLVCLCLAVHNPSHFSIQVKNSLLTSLAA